jgi:hypothetical protein
MNKFNFLKIVSSGNKSIVRLFLPLIVLLFSVNGLWAQAVGDYGSNASGNWTTVATWVVCVTPGTWTGATTATLATSATTNVWIRSGHTVLFDTSAKLCNNLTIENGGKLWTNAANTSPKYLRVYGSTITNNGIFGGTADALSIGMYGVTPQTLTLTGSGTYGICRIQPTIISPTVIIDANVLTTYAGSGGAGGTSIYNNTADNFILTINAGKTLTTANLSYIALGSSGSAAPAATGAYNITLNVNGTLTTGTSGHINLLNTTDASLVAKNSTINIGIQGVLNCNGNLLMPAAASTGTLNIASGGVLNINATSIFKIGGSVTSFTNNGTTNILGSFQIDEGLNATGSNFVYGSAGMLVINNAIPNFAISASSIYWPTTAGNVTIQNTGGVQMQAPCSIAGGLTVNTGATFKTGANTFTNNGTTTISGNFQIDEGGWATGNNFVYGTAGTLVFNNSLSAYGVSGTAAYWPTTSGPVNVTVQNTGGIQLQAPRTVTGLFQTAAGVGNTFGNDLTVSGTVKLNAGGYFSNFSPTFTTTGTLTYNTGSYSMGNEWGAGATPGYGVPQNVSILNASAVSLSGPRTVPGLLTLTSGKLILGANNLTIGATGSISGASSTNYIVTDGAGTLTLPVAAASTVVFPIGASTTSYDPATVNPTLAANFSAKVSGTLTGAAASGYNYNTKEWTLSSDAPSSTVVTLTPSTVIATGVNAIIGQYDGTNYVNVPATLTGSTYSATFTTFSQFVSGATDLPTSVSENHIQGVSFYGQTIHNNSNQYLQVFDVTGRLAVSSTKNIDMSSAVKGIYLVKSTSGTLKIVL